MDQKIDQELVTLLTETDIFQNLTELEIQELSHRLVKKKYESGKEIFREGDPGGKMLIISSGSVEIQKLRSHGTGRVVIARFERAGVIGEMSLIDNLPRSATVIAVRPTVVYELDKDGFNDLLENQKDISIKTLVGLAKLLSIRLRNTSGWFADVF